VVDVKEDIEVMFNISSQSMHILKQIRRLDNIKACVAKIVGLRKGQLDVVNSEVGLNLEIKGNVKAFVKGFAKGDPNPDSLDYFRSKSDAEDISYFSVVKLAENYRKHLAGLRKASAAVTKARSDNKYKGNGSHAYISKRLKGNGAAPMIFLRRLEEDGPKKPKGSFATTPSEVDKILHQAWDPITKGNHIDLRREAKEFVSKYDDCVFKCSPQKIEPLTVDEFKDSCCSNLKSAAGLDGWSSADLSLLSDRMLQLIVDWLNLIEEGKMSWPKHMLEVRTVFLNKDPDDSSNPLAYRPLKITSAIYRRWASARLRKLEKWIELWDDPALHVIGGKGAQCAWLKTAIRTEYLKHMLTDIAGGSIDIFKCFDQINRHIVWDLAKQAGMPIGVLTAYFEYIDNIQVKFQVGKTIGKAHHERCSIPQGCPFSMIIVALITRVWVKHIEKQNVEPRCLADDLLFVAGGSGHRARAITAMKQSRQFFIDMGAKVATNKCFMFATHANTRKFLADYKWDDQGLQLPV